uniref:Protein DCLic n=1 Tax=Rhizophora mucronata TaxID=61149 RepID=A0A2P2JN47_RHIMU
MASLSSQPPSLSLCGHSRPISVFSSPILLSFQLSLKLPRVRAVKTESEGSDLLRKPTVPAAKDYKEKEGDEWVDWEDRILKDTVPLVRFARMILHSGRYENGDRLSPEHERTIVDRLLAYHPDYEKKVGCGTDYITRVL